MSHFINLYQEEFLKAFFVLTLFIAIVALVVIMQEVVFYRLHKTKKYTKKKEKEEVPEWL